MTPALLADVSPELRLLLASMDGPDAPLCVDWERLMTLTRRHRLAPQVARQLAGHPAVPPRVTADLAELTRRTAVAGLAQAAELLAITDVLTRAGIPALTLKGPVEALLCRGGLGQRPAADIDLYITPADTRAALAVLGEAGWRPLQRALADVAGEDWIGTNQCMLRRAPGLPPVELHWRFINGFAAFPLTVRDGLARAVPVTLGGRTVNTLPPAERVLHLCAHGCEHRWGELSRLLDIAIHLRRGLPPEVATVAATMGLERHLALACHLASTLLGMPPASGDTPPPGWMRRLVTWSIAEMEAARPDRRLRGLAYALMLQPHLGRRLAVLRHVLRPREPDLDEADGPVGRMMSRLSQLFGRPTYRRR